MKKTKLLPFLTFVSMILFVNNVYAGEWDLYFGERNVIFLGNEKDDNTVLQNANGRTFSEVGNMVLQTKNSYRLTKLSNDLSTFIWSMLNDYSLEDGDIFLANAGYDWGQPKTFIMVLRINNGGKSFEYYAVRLY